MIKKIKVTVGKYKNQCHIIPNIALYIHNHFPSNGYIIVAKECWHGHFHIEFFCWYIEFQFGKDALYDYDEVNHRLAKNKESPHGQGVEV